MMNRYNIFNQIHKGLRVVLFETATLIQQSDFRSKAASAAAIVKLQQTLGYFDGHAEHEHGYIFPLINKVNPTLVAEFDSEHETDEMLARQMRELVSSWYNVEDGPLSWEIGRTILASFNEFIAFNLTHMNKEERVLNEVLWSYYSDHELMAVEQEIVASLPPELLFEESRFMMRGANDPELLGWLGGMKANAPAQVYELYLRMLDEEIAPARSQALARELATA